MSRRLVRGRIWQSLGLEWGVVLLNLSASSVTAPRFLFGDRWRSGIVCLGR